MLGYVYEAHRSEVKCAGELAALLAHCNLVTCGAVFYGAESANGSLLKADEGGRLPANWGAAARDTGALVLHYRTPAGDPLLLSVLAADQELLLSVSRPQRGGADGQVAQCILELSQLGTPGAERFQDAYPDVSTLEAALESLVKAVNTKDAPAASCSADRTQKAPKRPSMHSTSVESLRDDRFRGPLPHDYGRSDLHPFGSQGGMIFDPWRGDGALGPNPGLDQGLPPGAVPPGARFYPFRPPGLTDVFRNGGGVGGRGRGGGRYYPDPDAAMPPGWGGHDFI